MNIDGKDILFLAIGLLGGGVISYLIARNVIHRPKLIFNLFQAGFIDPRTYHNNLQLSAAGQPLQNIVVFNLEVSLKGRADLTAAAFDERTKPSIDFPGCKIFGVRTLNNDETRFNIPLGLANDGARVIVNLNRLRAGTTARFQIVGTFVARPEDLSGYSASFFPGASTNVDVETKGAIARPWKKSAA
ncbi:hypothetical protein [Caldimonas taiwanensis]|uniref:hypothetical protein n=1 Tax=Caldimonas taiwanensis TaxID=307483 RepID=UPI0007859824|nr:hypothetical protein [Caldimonas taiwanensis]